MRGLRRVQALQDRDYDHEISIVDDDHENVDAPVSPPPPSITTSSTSHVFPSHSPGLVQSTTCQALLGVPEQGDEESIQPEPSITIQQPTPLGDPPNQQDVALPSELPPNQNQSEPRPSKDKRPASADSALDLLFENQRGCMFCGFPLFSPKALGPLDPPAWTNTYGKPSPTDTKTAQPPDPSWEWAEPTWSVNRRENPDPDGWTYSFAFAKYFSWHKPRWWNSFVRRRVWFRRRVKVASHLDADPDHPSPLLRSGYFTVHPASYPPATSELGSRGSRPASLAASSSFSSVAAPSEIATVSTLVADVRRSRIDREKLEVIDTYLENISRADGCLEPPDRLAAEIPDLMGHLVFQASRETLLTRLTRARNEITNRLHDQDAPDSAELLGLRQALDEAVRCGEEEVRRLAY